MLTRRDYLRSVWQSHHLCTRELLKIIIPGRWQSSLILEDFCQKLGHSRLHLHEFEVEELFPGFEQIPVDITYLPRGSWSTPMTDQVVLAKLARLLQPRSILEVGSFRGYTARLLAENTSQDCVIHTIDIDANHGQAYAGTPLDSRIKRHVGSLHGALPDSFDGLKFDFIFLDADHRLESVENDTKAVLPLLTDNGVLLWHDYSDWGWMSAWNRVPEFLFTLSRKIPILSIPGTWIAVYRKDWTREALDRAIAIWKQKENLSHWDTPLIRGESQ